MKQVINDLYWEILDDLQKLKKSDMKLSDRIAYEKAIVKLETIKRILSISAITTS